MNCHPILDLLHGASMWMNDKKTGWNIQSGCQRLSTGQQTGRRIRSILTIVQNWKVGMRLNGHRLWECIWEERLRHYMPPFLNGWSRCRTGILWRQRWQTFCAAPAPASNVKQGYFKEQAPLYHEQPPAFVDHLRRLVPPVQIKFKEAKWGRWNMYQNMPFT